MADEKTREPTISELIDSLNSSLDSINKYDVKPSDKLPSDFEILMSGINGQSGRNYLFSPTIDKLISNIFELIVNGDYSTIIKYQDTIKKISDYIFGKGSFQGPISTKILNSIQNTRTSMKYNTMKQYLGKTLGTYKKIRMIEKNLEHDGKSLPKDQKEKYDEAMYAIKQLLKVAARIYKSRKLVNKKVYNGVHNIIHEEENNE